VLKFQKEEGSWIYRPLIYNGQIPKALYSAQQSTRNSTINDEIKLNKKWENRKKYI
jgi:hypothetical protein